MAFRIRDSAILLGCHRRIEAQRGQPFPALARHGSKQTSRPSRERAYANVCFRPKADIETDGDNQQIKAMPQVFATEFDASTDAVQPAFGTLTRQQRRP